MLLKDRVKRFKIFAGASIEELDKIISICQIHNFNNGDIVIEEDTIGTAIYIILEGRINVEMNTSSPRIPENKHIATRKAGDVLGMTSFIRKGRTVARLTAIDKVVAIKIDNNELNELCNSDNHLGYSIMRNIAFALDQRLIDLFFKLRND